MKTIRTTTLSRAALTPLASPLYLPYHDLPHYYCGLLYSLCVTILASQYPSHFPADNRHLQLESHVHVQYIFFYQNQLRGCIASILALVCNCLFSNIHASHRSPHLQGFELSCLPYHISSRHCYSVARFQLNLQAEQDVKTIDTWHFSALTSKASTGLPHPSDLVCIRLAAMFALLAYGITTARDHHNGYHSAEQGEIYHFCINAQRTCLLFSCHWFPPCISRIWYGLPFRITISYLPVTFCS